MGFIPEDKEERKRFYRVAIFVTPITIFSFFHIYLFNGGCYLGFYLTYCSMVRFTKNSLRQSPFSPI